MVSENARAKELERLILPGDTGSGAISSPRRGMELARASFVFSLFSLPLRFSKLVCAGEVDKGSRKLLRFVGVDSMEGRLKE